MNIEEINKTIERLFFSKTFDMSNYFNDDCGSPGCIAGHAVVEYIHYPYLEDAYRLAKNILELREPVADLLFTPPFSNYKRVTVDQAIKALEAVKRGDTRPWEVWPDYIEKDEYCAGYGEYGDDDC